MKRPSWLDTPRGKEALTAGLLYLVAAFVFVAPALLRGVSPYRGDVPVQFYPWKTLAWEMLHAGHVPLWNPHTHGGAPLLANMQSAILYPFDLALLWLDPAHLFTVALALHLALAGWAAFGLARWLGAGALGAWLAGMGYTYGGYTAMHLTAGNHLTIVGTLWLAPLMWAALALARAARERPAHMPRQAAILALVWTGQVLAGHPQMTFYNTLYAALAAGLWMVGASFRTWATALAWGLAALMLTGLMSAAQLLPTLEYTQLTARRGGLDFMAASQFSLAPSHWITFIAPDWYGSDAHDTYWAHWYNRAHGYTGLALLPLALAALCWRGRERAVWLLAALAGVSLLLALGRYSPVYPFVYDLPGFALFRSPVKFLSAQILAVPLLAALGLEALRQRRGFHLPTPRARWLPIATLAALIALACWWLPAERLAGWWPLTVGERVDPGVNPWTYILPALGRTGLLALALTLVWVIRLHTRPAALALGVVLVLDLWHFTWPHATQVDLKQATAVPEQVEPLAQSAERESYRIATAANMPSHNVAIPWGLLNASGYDPLALGRYLALVNRSQGLPAETFRDNLTLDNHDSPVLDLLAVRTVLTTTPLQSNRLHLVGPGLYKNDHALPRARIVAAWQQTSMDEALQQLIRPDHAPLHQPAPVETLPPRSGAPEQRTLAIPAHGIRTLPNRVEVDLPARHDGGLLVLADSYMPGWRALVDGQAREVFPAYVALRGVWLEPGDRHVEFVYQPTSWRVGVMLSALGAVLLAILALFARRGAQQRNLPKPRGHAIAPVGLRTGLG